jgi:hypothetical protein
MTPNTVKPTTPSTTTTKKLVVRTHVKAGPMWAR